MNKYNGKPDREGGEKRGSSAYNQGKKKNFSPKDLSEESRKQRKPEYDKPKKSYRDQDARDSGKKSFNNDRKSFSKPKDDYYKDKPSRRNPDPHGAPDFERVTPTRFKKELQDPVRFKKHYPEKDNRFGAKPDQIKKPRRYYEDEEEIEMKPLFPMPLNKYIAHSGVCSRRDAVALVKQGKVRVNGELILEPATKINEEDKVVIGGKKLTPEKDFVYILMNKPKGFITTTDDERGRKTVLDLIESAGVERVYPVGRLDRATTGLLLLTNDGDLAQKLSHPKYEIRKIYQVSLSKDLAEADFEKILKGVTLEDGVAKPDQLSYLESKREIGIEIHSGKNRIVRRIFESQGYEVEKLDRVSYAGLTKKNLPRGKWRFLDPKEIIFLKHFKNK